MFLLVEVPEWQYKIYLITSNPATGSFVTARKTGLLAISCRTRDASWSFLFVLADSTASHTGAAFLRMRLWPASPNSGRDGGSSVSIFCFISLCFRLPAAFFSATACCLLLPLLACAISSAFLQTKQKRGSLRGYYDRPCTRVYSPQSTLDNLE